MNRLVEPLPHPDGDRYATHAVVNQAAPAAGFNAFTDDAVLRAAIAREAPWATERCAALGALAGDEQVQDWARLANRHAPGSGRTIASAIASMGQNHPAWHSLMALAWSHEVHSLAWRRDAPGPSAPCSRTSGTRSAGTGAPPAWPARPTPGFRRAEPRAWKDKASHRLQFTAGRSRERAW
jgi:putative acyl-CoA dehydrogenase